VDKRRKPGLGYFFYYVVCLTAGFGLLAWQVPQANRGDILNIIFFIILTMITENMPVPLPKGGGTVSASLTVIFASALLFGPGGGLIVGTIGTITVDELTGKVPMRAMLFNRVQFAICSGLAGLAYVWLGGVPKMTTLPNDALALACSGCMLAFCNLSITGLYIALLRKTSFWSIWVANFRWLVPTYIVSIPIGIAIAMIFPSADLAGVLLFIFPLMLARYSFQRYAEMQRAFRGTIQALAAALEARDPHTSGHAERVARYAVDIGRHLALPEIQIELLEYVGILHDVGKIGIQDAILNKPGLFTMEEYREMKRHPQIGAEILKDVHLLGQGAQWVKHHHERFDGTGFPDGLSGEEISLGARIIAVADAFDAMISERPYKRALSLEEAKRELKVWSGRQFDPEVAAAFLECLESSGYVETILAAYGRTEVAPDKGPGPAEAEAAAAGERETGT